MYGDGQGVILFGNTDWVLDGIAKSKDWWLVREGGLGVLCRECI